MLNVTLDEKSSIAVLEPHGALCEGDFKEVARVIDGYLQKKGKLKGLIIYTKSFPGWDSFSALTTHLKFINEHHKKISYLAFVTDSMVGELAQHIGSHFVNATIKTFAFDKLKEAKRWIGGA